MPFSHRNLVLVMLMAVMIISVLDKSIFAFAGAQIIDELKLTPAEFGFIGSAFFFLYSISGVAVGFLANRFPSRWILVGMSLVWMVSQLLVSVSSSFAALVLSRLMLGAGTGPGTAVTQHACFKWFGPTERVMPASLIQVSIMLGAVLAAVSLPLLIAQVGWRMAYLALALIGLLWMLLWLAFGREGTQVDPVINRTGHPLPGYRRLLLNRTFLGITLIGFMGFLPNALVYSWVPVYLQKGLEMTAMQSGYVVMGVTLAVILCNLGVSALSQRALKEGASPQRAMVALPLACSLIAGFAFLLITQAHGHTLTTLALYATGAVLINVLPTFANTIVAFIAPGERRGSMLSIHIGGVTSAGMLAPWLVGQWVAVRGGDIAHGFESALAVIGTAIIVFTLIAFWLVRPEQTRMHLQAHESSLQPALHAG
ncbi:MULTISPECIES: MFS transporter [Pseudomonas]|uniref:MFS transporter n=1 Tax=Pseudomonas taiwanensis TaxID=470150 RepID=A0ABR6V761_9PSED|nr:MULTISPECIES: MFS transporter [Pseudomonas]AVD87749.1 MFS transporter [Pseudomonas sp. SWI44]MBC3476035.1 MFS transporter [Pseudomonas taiwanensis]MBC3490520.1 MFS transporter [Pseudomonas taiwanensis]MDT8926922.1 MFS transporter [Pseudomonas taiwanensis]